MAKRKEKIDKDTRLLIKLVTGFQERDENFHLCLTFADSNFKYHRYLSPDSHKIRRAVDGLCEKLEIHSQKQKATDLRELTQAFLAQPGLDGRDTGETDVHYALLSLLLELSHSPIQTDFQRKQKEIKPEEVDDFDWSSYLLQDINRNFCSYASSSCDESDESLSEESDEEKANEEDEADQKSAIREAERTDEAYGQQSCLRSVIQSHVSSVTSAVHHMTVSDEYTQLEQMLVTEYWRGKGREEDTAGSHAASNLARDWNCYLSKLNEFHTPRSQCVITEPQVIREVLWMLSGVKDLFIFKFNGQEFSLNPDVYLMHLTNECLESCMKPLMRKASQVASLHSFVSDIVSQISSAILCQGPTSTGPVGVPQTYQAFATCVSEFLSQYRGELVRIEKNVLEQDDLMTLAKLTSDLEAWHDKVQTVHSIYISGVTSASSLCQTTQVSNCFKSALLLDVLYQAVFEADMMSLTDTTDKSLLTLKMLVKTSQPLLEMTSEWINNGQLCDSAGEFVIQRNKEIKSLDETFWEKAFISNLHPSPNQTSSSEPAVVDLNPGANNPGANIPGANISGANIPATAHKNYQKPDSTEYIIKNGPKLLQPILAKVILTGKSMEMLENLGRLGEVQDISFRVFERPLTLYEHFVQDLKAKLEICETPVVQEIPPPKEIMYQDKQVRKQLQIKGDLDPLLNINFSGLFSHEKSTMKKQKSELNLRGTNRGITPLLKLCEGCLYPHISCRYQTVCLKLVHILKTEYHLLDCLQAMQRYYLMSSGELMYDFYTPIFKKIESREDWRDFSLLEIYLHEAVACRHPKDISRLSIEVLTGLQERTPISVTDCIHLKYNVPWPVNVVISGDCQLLYNNIFSFLIQVKRAKFTLDQLRFEEISRAQKVSRHEGETMPREKRIHRFQLLRFRLLYFINSLHNYIMTRILHSKGLEFATQLEGVTDLEQIISIHRDYVNAIHERCLLHPKLAFLKEAVMKVLNLALTFGLHWRQGVDFFSGDSIVEMEVELTRCVHFLAAFLNNVIKRGSFPHLESLAFALVSSLQNVTNG
ncbi:gamma-tubulin complex component 5-like [Physella acuta]|uniref:gamma-tubulin complex component 5-like n=1 Tax=Physella acuta TaxID=109671 RepID=UPI0027DDFAE9|nr:gamma-tubulin complex component 5-like [Physella acuta]